MQGMIIVDIKKCLACKSCELACAVAHSKSGDLPVAIRELPRPAPRVTVEAIGDQAAPLQCRHCEDAPCLAVCPSGALTSENEESPVIPVPEKCIGCQMCVVACPFGVIRLDRSGKAVLKCDLCIERLVAGEQPACVGSCHSRALRFMTQEEYLKERRKEGAKKYLVEME